MNTHCAALSSLWAYWSLPKRFACAYLDAGSGSMLIQLLLGGTAGLLMAIKLFWRKIRERLSPSMWGRRDRSVR